MCVETVFTFSTKLMMHTLYSFVKEIHYIMVRYLFNYSISKYIIKDTQMRTGEDL